MHPVSGARRKASSLTTAAAFAAMAAGVLFIAIQPLHPSDTLASVTTSTWVVVHGFTIAMAALWLIGIAGIYVRQVDRIGWLGLAGFVFLSLEMIVVMAYAFVEGFVLPPLAGEAPRFVEGFLGIIGGHASEVDLGALPSVWVMSGALMLLGCLSLGIASLRAGILSRWAAGIFAFGGPAAALMVVLLPEFERVAAVPIGVGLAWLGYSLWTEGRERAIEPLRAGATQEPSQSGTA